MDNRFCAVCGDMVSQGGGIQLGSGEYVCRECAGTDCRRCAKCSGLFRDIGMALIRRKWYCRACCDDLLGIPEGTEP